MAQNINVPESQVLEAALQQCTRALANPNLAASVLGSPEQEACLARIQEIRARITAIQNPPP